MLTSICFGVFPQNATQWKGVIKDGLQMALILIILDRIGLIDGGAQSRHDAQPSMPARRSTSGIIRSVPSPTAKLRPTPRAACGAIAAETPRPPRPLTRLPAHLWLRRCTDNWLESMLDVISVQATLFCPSGRKAPSWLSRLKTHLAFTTRLENN